MFLNMQSFENDNKKLIEKYFVFFEKMLKNSPEIFKILSYKNPGWIFSPFFLLNRFPSIGNQMSRISKIPSFR